MNSTHTTRNISHELYGSTAIFASAFCFYMATVAVRWGTAEGVALNSQFLSFFRFLIGFLVVSVSLLLKRKRPCFHHPHLLFARAFFNTLAVAFFFKAIEVTTVAQGNILNMTYPVFIAVISWVFFRQQRDHIAFAMAMVAFVGIVLVLSPGELRMNWDSLWGLASGITAAIAIIYLNLVRQHHDAESVLFAVFGFGTFSLLIVFWNYLTVPTTTQLFYLLLCAVTAVIGQYLLTIGFRYVSAVEGGIVSSTRILLAAILGPYLTSDPALALWGWIGAFLILGANVYFITRKLR